MLRRRAWLGALVGVALVAVGLALVLRRPVPEGSFIIAFGGDTFLGDRAQDLLEEHGYDWALAQLPSLADADLAFVNLETPLVAEYAPPVGPEYSRFRGSRVFNYTVPTSEGSARRYVMGGDPRTAAALARAGVGVVGLANNHALDMGAAGLAETYAALAAAGIVGIGAGETAALAADRHVVPTPFGNVAIVAFGKVVGTAPQATDDSAGINGLSMRNLMTAEREARAAGARWVVASVHWGRNYEPVLEEQEYWAERFAALGYDLVVGHGPHVAQRVALVKGTPVLYSLGNLVFNMAGRWTPDARGYGYVAEAVLTPSGFRELKLHCLVTDNKVVAYQPRACGLEEATEAFALWGVNPDQGGAVGTFTW